MNFSNFENEALDAIQPEFQFGRATYIGATLLHRLTLHRDLATITNRKKELNTNLLNSVCKRIWNEYTWREVICNSFVLDVNSPCSLAYSILYCLLH